MLKEYAIYLKDILYQHNGSHPRVVNAYGDIFFRLTQFIEEGKIKELIYRNDTFDTKKDVLNHMSDSIRIYIRDFHKIPEDLRVVLSYEEFLSVKRDQKIDQIL